MKQTGIVWTVVFYFLIVFFGVVLLAEVQLRSSGGATFDTWRLNYEANRILNANLVKNVETARETARYHANSASSIEACFRLFDERGLPIMGLLDEETAKEIEEAKQKHTPDEKLS